MNYFLGNGSGLNWSTENDIAATSTRYTVDSALVDGKPALAYLEYSSVDGLEHMFYASASNNNGTSWNAVEDTGVAVDASEFYLIENNGSPAMLLSASEGIFYVYFTP